MTNFLLYGIAMAVSDRAFLSVRAVRKELCSTSLKHKVPQSYSSARKTQICLTDFRDDDLWRSSE